jgi:RNA-binding protein YlmH
MKNFRGQMAKLKVYVVLLRSSTTSLRVQEVASFATTTLRNKAASAIDTSWVELNKL